MTSTGTAPDPTPGSPEGTPGAARAAIVDIDGTLIDSNYHHLLAWSRAFARYGVPVELWRIHRHMGMGGDRLVAAVAGEEVEEGHGDAIRAAWKAGYDELLPEVRVLDGAADLLGALRSRGMQVVLATSGKPDHTRAALELLGVEPDDYPLATSADAESTKPAPDLIEVALELAGTRRAFAIGDSPWDVEAADMAGLPTVCLLTGGFGEGELTTAGAAMVLPRPRDLIARLDEALEVLPR